MYLYLWVLQYPVKPPPWLTAAACHRGDIFCQNMSTILVLGRQEAFGDSIILSRQGWSGEVYSYDADDVLLCGMELTFSDGEYR